MKAPFILYFFRIMFASERERERECWRVRGTLFIHKKFGNLYSLISFEEMCCPGPLIERGVVCGRLLVFSLLSFFLSLFSLLKFYSSDVVAVVCSSIAVDGFSKVFDFRLIGSALNPFCCCCCTKGNSLIIMSLLEKLPFLSRNKAIFSG